MSVWLSQIFGPSFSPTNWVSGNRMKVYPGFTRGVNDAAGYDFEIVDTKQLFGGNVNARRALIEVKVTNY